MDHSSSFIKQQLLYAGREVEDGIKITSIGTKSVIADNISTASSFGEFVMNFGIFFCFYQVSAQ